RTGPRPPLSILAALGQVRERLFNVVHDAQEAQREQRLAIQIRIEPACGGNGQPGVTIPLRDNGPGFSSEVLARIFEAYVTTKPRGSGLGLPIVRRIVEDHGGHITVANAEAGGAEVKLWLPAG